MRTTGDKTIKAFENEISRITGHNPSHIRTIVNAWQSIIERELEAGRSIKLVGFGSFRMSLRPGKGITHKNGKRYEGYPHYIPYFCVSTSYKIKIRQLSKDPGSVLYCQNTQDTGK